MSNPAQKKPESAFKKNARQVAGAFMWGAKVGALVAGMVLTAGSAYAVVEWISPNKNS